MRRFCALALFALFPAFFTIQAQNAKAVAASARFSGPIDTSRKTPLKGFVPHFLESGIALSSEPLSSSTEMSNMVLVVKRAPEVQAAFEQLLADQVNPASPHYHQWLTPQQVGELYGPAQSDLEAVTGWLQSQGLTVTDVAPNRIFVTFKGTVNTVGRAFSTSFRNYHFANGQNQYSVESEPSVPEAIAPLVSTAAGFSQVIFYPTSHRVAEVPVSVITGKASDGGTVVFTPNYTNASSGAHYLTSGDFATIYNVKSAYLAGYTGTGQRVAIAGRARVSNNDITTLQGFEGQPSKTPTVIIPTSGVDPGPANTTVGSPDNGDQDEQTLDVNRVNGTAPGADIDLVVSVSVGAGGTTGTEGLYIAMNHAISVVNDPILSISYGSCEFGSSPALMDYNNSMFQTAASQGISVFVSSGDSGAATCNPNGGTIPAMQQLSINLLCDSPYVTCVGGTQFNDTASPSTYWGTNQSNNSSALSYIPEGAWNEEKLTGTTYTYGSTGGGVSTYIPKPSWQVGTGVPAGSFRWVPDVSFSAAGHDGYLTYLGYVSATSLYAFAGTSAAAPSMAGVQALANQKLGVRQGNINPKLYALAASTSNGVFHDTTVASSGVTGCAASTPSLCNNSTPSSSSLTGGLAGYVLTNGWDAATGWGSMDVANYLNALTATTTPVASSVAVILTPSTISAGGTTSLKATVTGTGGTPTGTVQFQSNGANIGSAATLASGVATVTSPAFSTPGTYSITAVYSGDTAFAGSTSPVATLTVNGVSTTTALVPATGTYPAKQPVTLIATVAGTGGTPTGTVTFKEGSTTLGTGTLAAGVANYTTSSLTAGAHTIVASYGGDTTFEPSTSNNSVLTITALSTTTTVTPSSSSITQAQTVTLSATVVGLGGTPSGTVTFKDGSTTLGTGTLASGSASFTTASNALSVGAHSITAVYGGDSFYATSTSTVAIVNVTATPGFTLTANPTSITLSAGAASGNIATISAAATNGFSSTASIALSCAITTSATIAPTCAVSPSTITTSTTATVTLTTIAPHAVGVPVSMNGHKTTVVLCALLLLGVPFAVRRRRWSSLLAVAFFAVLIAGANGCGGSGSSSSPAPKSGGTTPGTYTVVVTGTSAGAATQTANITLTVN